MTKEIIAEHYEDKNRKRNLGDFEIRIALSSDATDKVKVKSKRIRSGTQHPHVNSNGNCCRGNIRGSALKACADLNIRVLVEFVLLLLTTIYPSSVYSQPDELINREDMSSLVQP